MLKGIFAAIFLITTFLIPFNYYSLVKFSVMDLNAGWVFSTFFIRFVCIVLFVIALNLIFSFFDKTRKIKFIFVFLIGMIPGFGISFITPIYNTDYGDYSDELDLNSPAILTEHTKESYNPGPKRHLVAFFSTDCGHCKNTAAKLGINQVAGQQIDVHAFFANGPEDVMYFLDNNNGSYFIPHQIVDANLFLDISGFQLPSVFLIDQDGSTMKHWAGDVINYTALDYLSSIEP